MDILAIRGKTISAVICQLQWREFGRKFKIECCDQFSIFVFRNKNWSIDRIASDKSTKRGGRRRDLNGRKKEGAFYLSMLASFTGLICSRWTGCGYLAKRLLTISLFSAFNMVSLEKSVKVGEERSTCAVSTIKFHDVSLNWRPRRHNPTQTSLHAPPPPSPPRDLPLRGVRLKRIW